AWTESDAGHGGHLALEQETLRKIERAQARARDVDQSVERALRNHRQQSGLAEDLDQDVAATAEEVAELRHAVLGPRQRRLARLLRDGGGAGSNRLLQADRDRGELRRADEPAEAPPRHRIALGKSRDDENIGPQPEGRRRDVLAPEYDVFVDLVADEVKPAAAGDFREARHGG